MTPPDTRPVLICRLECPWHFLESLDAWMPKHFDDSLGHPAVTSAAHFAVIHDYEQLPAIFNGHGNRFIVYVLENLSGLMEWLDSPQIRAAIEDGADRESLYPPLDGEPFTGNIYEVDRVSVSIGSDFAGTGMLLVERFEVPPDQARQFDDWLNGPHFEAVASSPPVVRARTFQQSRDDAPKRFPYDRYASKGNRMLWADLEQGTELLDALADADLAGALADSVRWDVRLPYVRREVCRFLLVRRPEDAAQALADVLA